VREREGTLHLTPHHLVFRYADAKDDLWVRPPSVLSRDQLKSDAQLSHSLLQSLTVHPPSVTSYSPLVARTFTFETYTFLFRDFARAQEVCDSVKALVSSGATASCSCTPIL
jgi:hypothetical protein